MAKYKKIPMEYDVMQYTGDVDAVIAFGVSKVDFQQYKDKHVGIPTADKGIILCAIDDFITKDQFGNIEVVTKEKFIETYSDKI